MSLPPAIEAASKAYFARAEKKTKLTHKAVKAQVALMEMRQKAALKAKALRQALVEAKLLTAEEAEATPFELARFNPPFTLPPLRTNEIMIPVDDAAASRVCES